MHSQSKRNAIQQDGQEIADFYDQSLRKVCTCGATLAEHELTDDFETPCITTGCKGFTTTTRVSPFHKPTDRKVTKRWEF